MAHFDDKVAIVTGSSQQGIGLATAIRLASQGARVVLNARETNRLGQTVEALRSRSFDVVGVAGDVTVEGTSEKLVAAAIQTWGRIDLVVSNVGINAPPTRPHLTDRSGFQRAVLGSGWAALDLVRAAMESGLADGGGAVVNISSAVVRRLLAPTAAYAAGKIALESVTRSLAQDLGPDGVRVNAVAPGQTRSEAARPMWESNEDVLSATLPLRRLAEPDEIAAAVTYLLSDDASYITGQVLDVDGGFTLAGATPGLSATGTH